jgi:hypothetical protein
MCVLIFLQRLSKTFPILRIIKRDIVKNIETSSCQVPVTLSDLNKICIFFDGVSKTAKISNFVKIRPVGAELFQADRRKDGRRDGHNGANSRFSQFC